MATPSRVEDWFQLVPHLVWEEGANPAGSPLPWNHGGSDLRFQCPSTKCGGWGWRSLCIESFRPVNLIRDGVWDERIIISQYFFACCSNIFVFVSGRFADHGNLRSKTLPQCYVCPTGNHRPY